MQNLSAFRRQKSTFECFGFLWIFSRSDIICTTGRSQEDFDRDGTGDRLVLQNGRDELTDMPLAQDDVGSTVWTLGKCFPSMGTSLCPSRRRRNQPRRIDQSSALERDIGTPDRPPCEVWCIIFARDSIWSVKPVLEPFVVRTIAWYLSNDCRSLIVRNSQLNIHAIYCPTM